MKAEWFAGRLRELREKKGLTQKELAERTGVTTDGIAKLERGDRGPTWETVVVICQALGVKCEDFLREPAEREPAGPGRPRKATPAVQQPPPAAPGVPPAEVLIEEQEDKGDRPGKRLRDAFTLDPEAQAKPRKSKK